MVPTFGHRSIAKPDGSGADSWFSYACGHCGRAVSGAVVAYTTNGRGGAVRWLQCSACHDASVQTEYGTIYPPIPFGPKIDGLPPDVEAAFSEVRRCLGVKADTAAEGMCRKILMHIAVDKGAAEGKPFAFYLDYLAEQGYVTPPMKGWVNLIREHGNESQHRLRPPDRKRAEGTAMFTAQLLRTVYEMEHLANSFDIRKPEEPQDA